MAMPLHVVRAQALVTWLQEKLYGKSFDRKPHTHISATYLAVTLETHQAITVLLRENLRSSAIALVRVEFESFVRGLWVLQCCDDQKAIAVYDGKLHISIDKMIKQIETKPAYAHKMLSRYKSATWPMMSQFAHTGRQQLLRWTSDNEIGSRHTDEEMLKVSNSGALFACLAAMYVAGIYDDQELVDACVAKLHEYGLDEQDGTSS